MRDEQAIEKEIQESGADTAPRLTPEHIDQCVDSVEYWRVPGTTSTICAITLYNGFVVTGESASVSPENFNEKIGRKIAYGNARDKIWALEGYLLRTRLQEARS